MRQNKLYFTSNVITAFLLICTFISCNDASAKKVGDNKSEGNLKAIMETLHNPADPRIMICAHRGANTDGLPENSVATIKRSIEEGFDIVEIDISQTKDGHLILMHDKTLDRTTTGSGNVSDKTLEEIKTLYLKNEEGEITPEQIPTLDEVLDVAKDEILIQVDKWRGYIGDILPLLEEKGCLHQAIFRSTSYYDDVKPIFGDYMDQVLFIPVIPAHRDDAQKLFDDYLAKMPEIPVISIVFDEEELPLLDLVPELKKNYRIWFNAIQDKDCAGRGDEMAKYDTDNSFGWLIDKGGNIIFTHNPTLLKYYLQNQSEAL